MYVLKIIYSLLFIPPGLYISILVAAGIYFFRKSRTAAWFSLALAVLLWVGSNFLCSDSLLRTLEYRYQPPQEIQGDVIIVLGGGATKDSPNVFGQGHLSGAAANRIITAVHLQRKLGVPIIVSGGKVFSFTGNEAEISKTILRGLGVEEQMIIMESNSLNTTENALYTKQIVEARNYKKPILVTSAFHMPRAMLQFKKVRLEVSPYPTDYRTNRNASYSVFDLLPVPEALQQTAISCKEYLGIWAVKWY